MSERVIVSGMDRLCWIPMKMLVRILVSSTNLLVGLRTQYRKHLYLLFQKNDLFMKYSVLRI